MWASRIIEVIYIQHPNQLHTHTSNYRDRPKLCVSVCVCAYVCYLPVLRHRHILSQILWKREGLRNQGRQFVVAFTNMARIRSELIINSNVIFIINENVWLL